MTHPNLFIVGAAKCGTTALYSILAANADCNMCSVKEPSHFCSDLFENPDFSRTQSWARKLTQHCWYPDRSDYLALFPKSSAKWVGEASPTYLYSKAAAEEIYKFNRQARIIILLRNPIMRAWSEYRMRVARGSVTESFFEAVSLDHERWQAGELKLFETYVTAGMYAQQVRRYFEIFPRDQILVEVVDRPNINFSALSSLVGAFLDIEFHGRLPIVNASKAVRFRTLARFIYKADLSSILAECLPEPIKQILRRLYFKQEFEEMSADARSFLMKVFEEDIHHLSQLLNQDLHFWTGSGEPSYS